MKSHYQWKISGGEKRKAADTERGETRLDQNGVSIKFGKNPAVE
jgi:hypothetical protein